MMIMYNLTKLSLSSILISLIISGLSSPVAAQPLPPTIYVDAPSTVNVSTEFDVIIWIRDIPSGWGMVDLDIEVQWDPNDLEYIECELLTSWQGECKIVNPGLWYGSSSDPSGWTEDDAWFRIRFHCLRAGPAPITVDGDISLKILEGNIGAIRLLEPVTVTVNQVEPAPVGGVASPVNKLEILTPYLALAGLIALVSSVYVIKRRKD
jgi:hypothetical protein